MSFLDSKSFKIEGTIENEIPNVIVWSDTTKVVAATYIGAEGMHFLSILVFSPFIFTIFSVEIQATAPPRNVHNPPTSILKTINFQIQSK